jgi:hypothetical protein
MSDTYDILLWNSTLLMDKAPHKGMELQLTNEIQSEGNWEGRCV